MLGMTAGLLAATVSAATLTLGSGVPQPLRSGDSATRQQAIRDVAPLPAARARKPTTITVKWRSHGGRVRSQLLGVNLSYYHNGMHTWNAEADRPVRKVVARLRRADVTLIRYPGGISANLFDWKKAIGPTHRCQVDGRVHGGGYRAFRAGTGFGPDEQMRLARAAGSGVVLMVPFINETPADAANWVEYMNSRSGTAANPNGGVDWAERRAANGHPAPYHVHHWEIGNEQRLPKQRYWMSGHRPRALQQYVNGARPRTTGELLGKRCAHPPRGIASDGSRHQVFDTLYSPVKSGSIVLSIGGHRWSQVSRLTSASPRDRVFELRPAAGQVVFGDGVHGAVPPRGAVVRASYRSIHAGVFRYIRAMHRVDPSIQTCASWGLRGFVKAAHGRDFDCFSAHAFTHFKSEAHQHWSGPLEGHDWHMLGTGSERRFVAQLKRRLPGKVQLPLSEFGSLWGDAKAYPVWAASMTQAVYMASQWINWMELRTPWATGGDLISGNRRGLLGPAPGFTFSAQALTRTALSPMFEAGGRKLVTRLANNPRRHPGLHAGSYGALKVAASRGRDGRLYLLVVNRTPLSTGAVPTRVVLRGFTSRRTAEIRRVSGSSFHDWNHPGRRPSVRLVKDTRAIDRHGFRATFGPHSITLLRIPGRGR